MEKLYYLCIYYHMEESLEKLIRKVLFKKYPFLTDVLIEDGFSDLPNLSFMLGENYVCRFNSDKCLSSEEQMDIDTEVKHFFTMLSPISKNTRKPSISCFFDCGEGFEFKMSQGYNH